MNKRYFVHGTTNNKTSDIFFLQTLNAKNKLNFNDKLNRIEHFLLG